MHVGFSKFFIIWEQVGRYSENVMGNQYVNMSICEKVGFIFIDYITKMYFWKVKRKKSSILCSDEGILGRETVDLRCLSELPISLWITALMSSQSRCMTRCAGTDPAWELWFIVMRSVGSPSLTQQWCHLSKIMVCTSLICWYIVMESYLIFDGRHVRIMRYTMATTFDSKFVNK